MRRGVSIIVMVLALAQPGSFAALDAGAASHPRAAAIAGHSHDDQSGAPVPFTSNGCSGFREGKFFSCCFVHDFAFWAGGSRDERHEADLALRRCLVDVTEGNLYDRFIADIGFLLMLLERIPGEVVNDGWGRGWRSRSRGKYDALSPDQRALVQMERRRVCATLVFDPRSGRYRYNGSQELLPIAARSLCGTF